MGDKMNRTQSSLEILPSSSSSLVVARQARPRSPTSDKPGKNVCKIFSLFESPIFVY